MVALVFVPLAAHPVASAATRTYGTINGFKLYEKPTSQLKTFIEKVSKNLSSQSMWNSLETPSQAESGAIKELTDSRYRVQRNGVLVFDRGVKFILRPSAVIWSPNARNKGLDWVYTVRNIRTNAPMTDLRIFGGVAPIDSEADINPLKLALEIPWAIGMYTTSKLTPKSLSNLPFYYGKVTIDFVNPRGSAVEISNPYLMNQQDWSINGKTIPSDVVGPTELWMWFEQTVNR